MNPFTPRYAYGLSPLASRDGQERFRFGAMAIAA